MERLGHIELANQKVLDIFLRDNVVQIRLGNEHLSFNAHRENVKVLKRGDIVCVDNGIGVVNWINARNEVNVFINGSEDVYVYKFQGWIRLSDFRKRDKYLQVAIRNLKTKKKNKKKSSANVKNCKNPATNTCRSCSDNNISPIKKNAERNNVKDSRIKSRVAHLMKACPTLSSHLAEKVVLQKMPIAVALKRARKGLHSHTLRRKRVCLSSSYRSSLAYLGCSEKTIDYSSPYGTIQYGSRGERFPLSSQGLAGDKRKRQLEYKLRRKK